MSLPRAIVNGAGSWVRATGAWLSCRIRRTLQLGIIGALIAAGYGVTQVSCRNDAITFAHAIYKHASCTALQTYILNARYDTAVCRVTLGDGKEMVVRCSADDPPTCKDVFQ